MITEVWLLFVGPSTLEVRLGWPTGPRFLEHLGVDQYFCPQMTMGTCSHSVGHISLLEGQLFRGRCFRDLFLTTANSFFARFLPPASLDWGQKTSGAGQADLDQELRRRRRGMVWISSSRSLRVVSIFPKKPTRDEGFVIP